MFGMISAHILSPATSCDTPAGRQQAPRLHFNSVTGAIALALPPATAWEEDIRWSVRVDDGAVREFALGDATVFVDIHEPWSRAHVVLDTHVFTFPGLGEAQPFLILDDAHRVIDATEGLHPGVYTFVVPRGTTVGGAAAIQPAHWKDWATIEVDARKLDAIAVALPMGPAHDIPVTQRQEISWNTQVKALPNARSVDGEPVFTASPQILVNGDGGYSFELVYAPVEGEREPISEEALPEGIHEIFPADLYEDAWVGRYEVILYQGGQEIDSRYFTMVEGLHMRATNDGPRGTAFRSIDATGALSPFTYTLASPPTKPVVFDKGPRAFESDEATRWESFSSDAGYVADVEIVPAAVTARVEYTGQEAQEFSSKQLLYAGQLDEHGEFSVHAPEPLPLAKFVSIDKRAKIRDLMKVEGTTEALRSLSMPNSALKEALGKQSAIEIYLLWSTLTYDAYLDSLSEDERATHLAQPADRRQVEYEASAASDLIYAGLATVRKTPLATRGVVLSDTIEVELAEEADVIGWGWPLAEPTAEPVSLERTESGFALAEALRDRGPVILDVRELQPGTDLAAPKRAASSSLVLEGEGQPGAPADTAEAVAFYRALRDVAVRSHNSKLETLMKELSAQLTATPTALDFFPADERATVAYATGLYLRPLPEDALSDVSAELADMRAQGIDAVTRPLLLQAALGTEPTPASTHPGDAGARVAALRECFAHDEALDQLHVLRGLHNTASQLAAALQQVGVDMSVSHTLIALEAFATAPTGFLAAARVPLVSYTFSLVTRLLAHGVIEDATVRVLLDNASGELAQVAKLAPQLFAYDILTGEALARFLAEA